MLLLLLGFWDLFAVLAPIGPLRWLVNLVHEKGTPLPGLLFQADIVDAHGGKSTSTASASEHEAKQSARGAAQVAPVNSDAHAAQHKKLDLVSDDEQRDNGDDSECEDKTIKLGLGDFIFYSVLVARAATHGMSVFAPCFLCILIVRGAAVIHTCL